MKLFLDFFPILLFFAAFKFAGIFAATAIAMGGPGAIFWMWIAAFFGMATIFVEAVLAHGLEAAVLEL